MLQIPATTRADSAPQVEPIPAVSLPRTPFDRALTLVLRFEGGISRDPRDRANAGGRATNQGITQRTYDGWRDGHRQGRQDVTALTDQEVRQIYQENYWQRGRCDRLEGAVAIAHMDACVNMGVTRASKLLQQSLRDLGRDEVRVDGKSGPITLTAAQNVDQAELLNAMLNLREERYQRMGRNERHAPFLNGWLNRVRDLRNELEH